MNSPNPMVTVGIPTYNRAGYLKKAIASVLSQTYSPIEILISDNASNDGTAAFLASIDDSRLRYVTQASNVGMIGNWNACLDLARGEYFLLLSDDDRLAPDALRELMNAFSIREREQILAQPDDGAFVYGYCEIENAFFGTATRSRCAPLSERSEEYRIGFLKSKRVNYPSATLFRTKDIRSIGGYSTRYGPATDVGVSFEISALYPTVLCTGTVVTHYLFHPQNVSSSTSVDVLVDAVGALGEVAIVQAGRPSAELSRAVRMATAWAQSTMLLQTTVERHFSGSLSLRDVLRHIWYRRNLFRNIECAVLLLRAVVKLILFAVFGWRRTLPVNPGGKPN